MFGISAYAQSPYASLEGSYISVALTGKSASAFVGVLTPSSPVALSGLTSSGFVGTLSPVPSIGLTGNLASGFVWDGKS
jgi:hypothetical protein